MYRYIYRSLLHLIAIYRYSTTFSWRMHVACTAWWMSLTFGQKAGPGYAAAEAVDFMVRAGRWFSRTVPRKTGVPMRFWSKIQWVDRVATFHKFDLHINIKNTMGTSWNIPTISRCSQHVPPPKKTHQISQMSRYVQIKEICNLKWWSLRGSARSSMLKSFMEKHPLLPHPVKLLMPKAPKWLVTDRTRVLQEVFIVSWISVVLCPTSSLILQTYKSREESSFNVWDDKVLTARLGYSTQSFSRVDMLANLAQPRLPWHVMVLFRMVGPFSIFGHLHFGSVWLFLISLLVIVTIGWLILIQMVQVSNFSFNPH